MTCDYQMAPWEGPDLAGRIPMAMGSSCWPSHEIRLDQGSWVSGKLIQTYTIASLLQEREMALVSFLLLLYAYCFTLCTLN